MSTRLVVVVVVVVVSIVGVVGVVGLLVALTKSATGTRCEQIKWENMMQHNVVGQIFKYKYRIHLRIRRVLKGGLNFKMVSAAHEFS